MVASAKVTTEITAEKRQETASGALYDSPQSRKRRTYGIEDSLWTMGMGWLGWALVTRAQLIPLASFRLQHRLRVERISMRQN